MKFSILIANYNNGKFFKDCFLSICAQSYQNWEVVILDDASTDDSVAIIKDIISGDSRFRFYENKENKGVGFTKSKLIDLANGEICGYLDPDDAILENALQASIDIFKTKKSAVLTYSRLVKCDENLNPLEEFRAAMQVPNGDKNFFNCPIQIAPFVGFKKAVYLKCEKMNETLKIAEDQDLYFKMYEKGKVYFVNQTDYLYRAHSGGISQNENKQKSYDFWAVAIFNAMKRRGLKSINGKQIPEKFTTPKDIFDLLVYQNSIPYRIKKKLKVIFQSLF
ncbi:Glycosyltransferase involved in cell wall bisynthesis [Halpernia humi]|uniref:Glycosyltransferase involved in cell wall bisynthesis n=1 Tax=Halpernia humi TaxID=493375 RepID=A0A1H5W7T9_9FLAO|nr:glycosyltransferase [Halpernia humi]SEF95286.1 Glycosyltransferase involved in cell wall bisynthesis [Halpernia humi]